MTLKTIAALALILSVSPAFAQRSVVRSEGRPVIEAKTPEQIKKQLEERRKGGAAAVAKPTTEVRKVNARMSGDARAVRLEQAAKSDAMCDAGCNQTAQALADIASGKNGLTGAPAVKAAGVIKAVDSAELATGGKLTGRVAQIQSSELKKAGVDEKALRDNCRK